MEQANISRKGAKDIEKMFSGISRWYDFINHFASIGLDIGWRKAAARLAGVRNGDKIIDFCCGTGDLAFAFARNNTRPVEILGCDFSQEMLTLAERKLSRFAKKGEFEDTKFSWLKCDCTDIPISDNSFDMASCAFGLRNIPNFRAALKEMHRILKPGGKVCILEFSLPKETIFRKIYLFYFCHLLPRIAGFLSGHPQAYKHLSDSVCRWDNAVDLVEELRNAGFSDVMAAPLTMSVAVVFTAKR